MNEMYRPGPAFVETLGREVESALRRREAFDDSGPSVKRNGVRLFSFVAVIAAASMCIGGAGAFAVVKKRDAEMADLNIARASTLVEFAHLRVEMFDEELHRMQQLVEEGVATERELAAMESEAHMLHLTEMIRSLDLEEVQATGLDPDNGLSAPLVDGRDFVRERLSMERDIEMVRLQALTREAERSGIDRNERAAVMGEVQRQELAIGRLERKLERRRSFLDGEVSAADLEWHELFEKAAGREREAALHLKRVIAAHDEQQSRIGEAGDSHDLRAMEYEIRNAELQLRLAKLEVEAARRRIEAGRASD